MRQDIIRIAKHCPNLYTLAIHVRLLDENVVIDIVTLCTHIAVLDLYECIQLTTSSILHIALTLTSLHTLKLDGRSLQSEELHSLQYRANTLTTLDVRNFSLYARSGIYNTLQTCTHLTTLTLQLTYLDYSFKSIDMDWSLLHNIQKFIIVNTKNDNSDPRCVSLFQYIALYCINITHLYFDFLLLDASLITIIIEQCNLLCVFACRKSAFYNPDEIEVWVEMKPNLIICDISEVQTYDVFGGNVI